MKINVDFSTLIKYQLTPDEFIYLYKKFTGDTSQVLLRLEVSDLESRGFILNGVLQEKTLEIFEKDNLEWIDEWRELFPKIKIQGYPLRGDRGGCLKKMRSFLNKYPEYTKDLIFRATRLYLDNKKKEFYAYTTLAHYFIDKEGVSLLASYCEMILEGEETVKETGKVEGI